MEMHRATGNWKLGLSLSLITVTLWGLVPVAIAIVLKTIDTYTINWFRFLTAFILLGIHLFRQNNLPKLARVTSIPAYLWAIAVLGLMGNYIFFVLGLKATSPSHAEVLIQLAGVFLSLGGLVIFKERYTRSQWIGVGILLAGFIGFFAEQFKAIASQFGRADFIGGSIMVVVAALTWAAYALVQKQLLLKLASAHIMWIIYGACGLLFWPFARPQTLGQLDPIGWSALIFCGLNTVVAYGSFAESLQHWEASRVSAILALAPIFTIGSMAIIEAIAPNIVTPERMTLLGLFGAVLVVAGSMSIALGRGESG